MKKKLKPIYWIIPVIYLSIIAFFLYLHFSSKENFIESSAGEIRVSGVRSTVDKRNPEIVKLSVVYKDLEFLFTSKTPLVLEEEDGRSVFLFPVSYSKMEWGVRLIFKDKSSPTAEVTLDFKNSSAPGDQLLLTYKLPERWYNRRGISLPLITGCTIKQMENIPLLSLSGETRQYFLWTGTPFLGVYEGEYLKIIDTAVLSGNSNPEHFTLTLDIPEEKGHDPYLFWFGMNGMLGSETAYREVLKKYMDQAYLGWIKERFTYVTGRWNQGGEEYTAYKGIGEALISEGLMRDEYTRAYFVYNAFITTNPELIQNGFTNRSAVFMGNLEEYFTRAAALEQKFLKQIEEQIRQGNPEVFKTDDLISHILNNGKFSEIDNLIENLILPLDLRKLDIDTCLGYLAVYFEVLEWLDTKKEYFTHSNAIMEEKVLPLLHYNESGLFIRENGVINLIQTIKAGMTLIKYGQLKDNPELRDAGYGLVTSVLILGENHGVLPDNIYPEQLYKYITTTPYYPKEIPLYPVLNPGAWIYTAAELKSFSVNNTGIIMKLKYKPGHIHHFFIRNLDSIKGVKIRGQLYFPNQLYRFTNDGWFYNETTRTLFMKILHYSEDETIELYY